MTRGAQQVRRLARRLWAPLVLLGLYLCLLQILAIAILWYNRWSMAIWAIVGAIAGPVALLVLLTLWRRRWGKVFLAVALAGALPALAGLWWMLRPLPYGGGVIDGEGVPYEGRGVISSNFLEVTEKITWDRDRYPSPADEARLDAWASGNGWRLERKVNGARVYGRFRAWPVRQTSVAEREVRLPLDLGKAPNARHLLLAEGSLLTITAPKGTLRVTSPPSGQLADLPGGKEMAIIPLDLASDQVVVVAVRPSWLRNPLGRSLDNLITWGPVGWAVGLLAAVVPMIAVGQITTRADSFLRRLLKGARRPPPKPRMPLRGGGAQLVVRNPRKPGRPEQRKVLRPPNRRRPSPGGR